MKIRLITVGKIKSPSHQAIALDYAKRISHYTSFEIITAKNEEDVVKKLVQDDFVVACDEHGREMTSREFATFINEKQIRSTRYLTFVIGQAEGLGQKIKERASLPFAFSKFTMQHDLAQLVLLEQIYRAFTIIKGEPYHK